VAFAVRVEGLSAGAEIPRRYTCDGEDIPPRVQWTDEPASTKSFAVIVDDPDAPGGTWTHWLVWDIPAGVRSLSPETQKIQGVKSGTNDFGKRGYGGPCPPRGRGPHRYFFRVFALNVASLELREGANRMPVEEAIHRHLVAEASFMGRYERK
jgi:Raf kinase inhibitor-like YbhB/YbcL family protein